MTDIEGDFWKDKLVHMTHKNMMRIGAEKLYFTDCQKEYDIFAQKHPELNVEITNTQSYSTWETFVTDTIKLRIFIQSQIKVTFLQKEKGDLIKLADAKFPFNPFPEIDEFLQHIQYYNEELNKLLIDQSRESRKQKLAGEFIKANLKKKYKTGTAVWQLETFPEYFKLTVENTEQKVEKKYYELHCDTFIEELKKI